MPPRIGRGVGSRAVGSRGSVGTRGPILPSPCRTCRSRSLPISPAGWRPRSTWRARSSAASRRSDPSPGVTSCSSTGRHRRSRPAWTALGARIRHRAGRRALSARPARGVDRRRRRPLVRLPRGRCGRARRGRPGPSSRAAASSSSTTTAATTSSRLLGDRPEYGAWSHRGGTVPDGRVPRPRPPLLLDVRVARGHARRSSSRPSARQGEAVASTLKRPRLSYNVAIYHRSRGGPA